jgi:asparagine synthase (glutamine-hydrolysing)
MTRIYGYAGGWTNDFDPSILPQHIPLGLQVAQIAPLGGLLASAGVVREGNLMIAVQGQPVWVRGPRAWQRAAVEQILTAYRQAGIDAVADLGGRFSLVIVDGDGDQVLLAVDPMGIGRLCWAQVGRGIVFGDSAEAVADFPPVKASLRAQAVHDFLLMHMIPSPDTAYDRVHKLEPGTRLVFRNGGVVLQRWWAPTFHEHGAKSFESLQGDLHSALESAVRRCEPDEHAGAFLSGGLDSSTVAGMLGKASGRPARTFSIGFGVESHDEIRYARISARKFGCDATEYNVTADDIVETFDSIAATYDEPFGNSSAVPTFFCAKVAARAGVSHLLAGDGGDELFGGNERYGKQQVFELYSGLPRWLRGGILEPLSRSIPAEGGVAPLRKFRSYVQQARIPLPERLESWNLFYRTPHGEIFEPEFSKQVDTRRPIELMSRVYRSAPKGTLLNRMMHYDWHFTLADSDLRKVITMCDLAGIQVSFPMLDPQVVDLSLRVPTAMKMRGRELRSFYKRAMTGFLPDEVINKPKHGFGLPFGVWLKEHQPLRELILGHLQRLGERGIFRRSFLEKIVAEHARGEPGYYGYAIWDFAMFEAWLAAHRPRGV